MHTVYGLLLPWNVTGVSGGRRWRFPPGSVHVADKRRVRLLVEHDHAQWIGWSTSFRHTSRGLWVTAAIRPTAKGMRALARAEDGIRVGLSAGFDPHSFVSHLDGMDSVVDWAELTDISLTRTPTYQAAQVTKIRRETR